MSKKLDKVLYEISLFKRALEFSSKEELQKYLKLHPGADPENHSVREKEEKSPEQVKKETKAKKGLSVAKKTLDSAGVSGDDYYNIRGLIERDLERGLTGWHGKDFTLKGKSKMSPGGGAATTALTDIGKKILGKEDLDVDGLKSNIRSKFGEVEENGYDYERETTEEVRKQRVRAQRLVDFLDSGEAKIPYSALRSQKDLTSYVDDLKQSAVDMIAVLNGGITQMYPKGATKQEKTFSVQDLPKEAQKQIEEIQKSIEESFKDFDVKEKVGEKTIAVMNYMQAESDFDEATGNERPKFTRTNKENALKALEGDSAGADQSDDEESKSLDEMSPQELKESLEEAIEKSNMDPEEKKKAIKRMKKMKPEDMKAQMIAMMGDEEGEAMGKQARLKKARSLLRQIEANEALIYNLERKLKIALRR